MIPVTKPYLPNRKKLEKYIDGIYERQWLTNNGPLVQELTTRLESYLGVENLLLVSNGTLALQVAYKALGINKTAEGQPAQAITTPFSFAATASSLRWEGISPIFSDIDENSWCIDPKLIESAITQTTTAIVPVHVFGNACNVEELEVLAQKHNLKIIYDAAHAFGVKYKGESLLNWGDAATLSFHATKVFQTIEGGAIIFKNKNDLERAKKIINFGIVNSEEVITDGINAKMNEFQAAMGLSVLDEIEDNIAKRKHIWEQYQRELGDQFQLQEQAANLSYNYSYFPIVFKNESTLIEIDNSLRKKDIFARRYFYPSLDLLDYSNVKSKPANKSIALSKNILCLPIYSSLSREDVELVIKTIMKEA